MSEPSEDNLSWTGAAAAWAWAKRDQILGRLHGVYEWYKGKDNRPIAILGPGGTGKSTLSRLLCGEYEFLFDAPKAYEESLDTEKSKLKDSRIEMVVPPGQEHRREATWTELYRDVADGKFRGIILLSAYGYHSFGDISYKLHRAYKGDDEAFLRAY